MHNKDLFQQARKTFKGTKRLDTLIFTSKLVSPFHCTMDIKNLNKRTHKYNGMYQEEEKETPISNKGKFHRNVLKKHKKLSESKRKDAIHTVIPSDKKFSTRIQYLLKEL